MSADWDTSDRPGGAQETSAEEQTTPTPSGTPETSPEETAQTTTQDTTQHTIQENTHDTSPTAPSVDDLAARFRAAPLRAPEGPMSLPSARAGTPREIPPHVRRVFLEETAEDMEHMRAAYLQVTHDAPDPAKQYHTLKQIAHKIKGSAATFSYPLIAQVALATEEWIGQADTTATLARREEIERRIGEGLTLLDALVADASEGREPAPDLTARVTAFADASVPPAAAHDKGETRPLSTVSAAPTQAPVSSPITSRPDALPEALDMPPDAPGGEADPGLMLHVPSRQVDSLINQLSEVAVNRALLASVRADLATLEDELCRTQERLASRTEIIGDAYPQRAHPPTGAPPSERQEEVTLAVNSLREAVDDLGAHVAQFRTLLGTLGHAARQQDEQMRAVRDEAVDMRLVPFSALETRLRVTAEMCARDCGKAVDLTITGGETRIDREMVDQLRGPLTQLVTNAVVHAIEAPEERARAGKPKRGQILVEARLRQSEVHLTVADDGHGTDARGLVRAAIDHGTLTDEQARDLSPARALNLMFEPGLTTEDTAGLLAGRGIGLDQVRTTVRDLRGQIAVQSNTGQGTIFRLRLPISQTVLTVIEVSSAGEHYAVPLPLLSGVFSLTRSGPPLPGALPAPGMGGPRSVGAMTGAMTGAMIMEERARLVERLAAHVDGNGAELAPPDGVRVLSLSALVGQRTSGTGEVALLLEVDGGYTAVLVDEVLGEREVVVRPLPTYLRRSSIWGAAVTPEGEMLLLLDLPTLVRAAGPETARDGMPSPRAEDQARVSGGQGAHVLVVDDSPTVRHNVSGILKQAGYRITEARDGVEAIGQLAEMPTDVIVLDIEMPDLDGLGLLHILKSNPHFAGVPVVVLSSRDTAETRQQAHALGAHAFLTKPCRSEHLLSAVRRLVTR